MQQASREDHSSNGRPAEAASSSLQAGNAATPAVAPVEPTPVDAVELETFLVNFIVEQTGYPAEIVELDADLEADLGIDSIKKAQMFGELREHFSFDLQSADSLSLDDFPTLRHVMTFLQAATNAGTAEPAAQTEAAASPNDAVPLRNETASPAVAMAPEPPVAAGPEPHELESFLINFVVEQTGYPAEIVELDADLEADLGIDSIKKAQMFGELREVFAFDLQAAEGLSLDDFPTLRHVLQLLAQTPARASTAAVVAPSPNGSAARTHSGDSPILKDASILDALRRILIEQGIADAARVNLTRHTRLMDDVGLDSVGMLDLIHAVEKEFDISVELDDLDLTGLNSTSTLAALIQRKLAGTPQVGLRRC